MLPGKQYTPDDLLAIFRRRFWLLLVPCAVVAAATALVARRLPDRYRSEAVVLVVPRQVPEAYVRSVTTRIEDRLQAISQEILSRTRLERIIDEFKLYQDERRVGIMQDIVEEMRKDITVAVVKGDAFKVAYVGSNARTVQQVTARIASLFIEESLRDRSTLVEGTTQFLEVQLEDARRRLIEQEKKLEAYRVQFSGQLPSQLAANLQSLQNTQMQIQATLEALNHDRDQQLVLQRQIADLQGEAADAAAAAAVAAPAPEAAATPDALPKGSTGQQLTAARNLLASLQQRYKPDYPDIPRLQRLIRDLEKQLDAEAVGVPLSAAAGAGGGASAGAGAADLSGASLKEQAREKRIADLRGQLRQIEERIASSQSNEERLRAAASEYQQKIDQVPARESDMTELTRDYGTLQTVYTNLLSKKEESNIAANLERRQIGEQFKLLDPALVAERPFSPNRLAITGFGVAAGLGLGLALLALLEFRDSSFKTDDEMTRLLALPVLAVVPRMQSQIDRSREVWRRRVVGVWLGSTVVACFTVVLYTLVR